ncbi:MAG: hypothetical protein R3D81_09665 [Thalassovita sp.]
MEAAEMDRVSQGMIDGCANYTGDPAITAQSRTVPHPLIGMMR